MEAREKRQLAWKKGRRAEELAGWFLQMKGYQVVARNVRLTSGEIDLIVSRGDMLVAVEVKARASVEEGLEAVSERQQRRIANAMSEWLGKEDNQGKNDWLGYDIRYDVVVVKKGWRLPYHMENAYGI